MIAPRKTLHRHCIDISILKSKKCLPYSVSNDGCHFAMPLPFPEIVVGFDDCRHFLCHFSLFFLGGLLNNLALLESLNSYSTFMHSVVRPNQTSTRIYHSVQSSSLFFVIASLVVFRAHLHFYVCGCGNGSPSI